MKSMSEKRKTQLMLGVFALCVFAFLLVFFLGYYPLTVNNLDDWTYLRFGRPAVPQAAQWNPARVLPEILMPACAQLAVWLVMPLTGDYLLAMSLVFSVVLCLFITVYVLLFARLLMRVMKIEAPMAALLSVLFLVFHFRSWMSVWIPSQHLFYSEGLTTTYYYTIPALLNIMLVLMMEAAQNRVVSCDRPIAGGMMILLLYLAVFSNLYSSVIIAVYCGVSVVFSFVKKLREKTSLCAWLKRCVLQIGVLGMWFVSMFFELFGSRADSMGASGSLFARIKHTISVLLMEVERMEDTVFWLTFLMIAAGIVLLAFSRGKKEEDRTYAMAMLRYLACAGLTLIYLILLSAVVSTSYIARKDVLIGVMFFVFAAAFCSLAYIIRKWRPVAFVLPLVTFVIAFDVLIGIGSFAQSNALGLPQRTCLEIGQSFVAQLLEADKAGKSKVTIAVPPGSARQGNWPYTYNMGYRMADALRDHGLIEHIQDVYIEIDEQFFETFGAE